MRKYDLSHYSFYSLSNQFYFCSFITLLKNPSFQFMILKFICWNDIMRNVTTELTGKIFRCNYDKSVENVWRKMWRISRDVSNLCIRWWQRGSGNFEVRGKTIQRYFFHSKLQPFFFIETMISFAGKLSSRMVILVRLLQPQKKRGSKIARDQTSILIVW